MSVGGAGSLAGPRVIEVGHDTSLASVDRNDQALEAGLVTVGMGEGDLRLVGLPIHIHGRPAPYGPPPQLGGHTPFFAAGPAPATASAS